MAIMYNDGFDMFDALLQILKTHFLRNAKSEQAAKKKHAKKKHKALDRRASLPFAHTRVCVCVWNPWNHKESFDFACEQL